MLNRTMETVAKLALGSAIAIAVGVVCAIWTDRDTIAWQADAAPAFQRALHGALSFPL